MAEKEETMSVESCGRLQWYGSVQTLMDKGARCSLTNSFPSSLIGLSMNQAFKCEAVKLTSCCLSEHHMHFSNDRLVIENELCVRACKEERMVEHIVRSS